MDGVLLQVKINFEETVFFSKTRVDLKNKHQLKVTCYQNFPWGVHNEDLAFCKKLN